MDLVSETIPKSILFCSGRLYRVSGGPLTVSAYQDLYGSKGENVSPEIWVWTWASKRVAEYATIVVYHINKGTVFFGWLVTSIEPFQLPRRGDTWSWCKCCKL